jgi:hypothetical protein
MSNREKIEQVAALLAELPGEWRLSGNDAQAVETVAGVTDKAVDKYGYKAKDDRPTWIIESASILIGRLTIYAQHGRPATGEEAMAIERHADDSITFGETLDIPF